MILVIYLVTPFTMTHSIHLFQGFRIIQTRMMVLAILHGLRPNPKLKSILEGCADLKHLWGNTLHSHNLFSRPFFQPQSVYIRFTHIANMQPKFYVGSAMHSTLDREYSRSRKYLQLTKDLFKQSWHFAIGKIMTTCTFGLRSPFIQTGRTIVALKWPSFRSGNPDSTIPSYVNSSTQRRASSKNPFSTPKHNLAWPPYGVVPNTKSLHNSSVKS